MRVLLIAKRSARSERARTLNQMRHIVFVAPDAIRARFQGLSRRRPDPRQTSTMRPRPGNQVDYVTLCTLRELGRRAVGLEDEIGRLDAHARADRHRPRPGPARRCTAAGSSSPRDLVGHRRRPTRTDPLRSGVGPHVRRRADPGELGQDHRPLPPQPRWEPPSQLGAAPHRAHPHAQPRRRPRSTSSAAATKAAPRPEIMRSLKRYVARETFKHLPGPAPDHLRFWSGSGSRPPAGATSVAAFRSTCRPAPTPTGRSPNASGRLPQQNRRPAAFEGRLESTLWDTLDPNRRFAFWVTSHVWGAAPRKDGCHAQEVPAGVQA